jgi:hypothetical protein
MDTPHAVPAFALPAIANIVHTAIVRIIFFIVTFFLVKPRGFG